MSEDRDNPVIPPGYVEMITQWNFPLRDYCLFLSRPDKSKADDLFQATCLKALCLWETLENRNSPFPWLRAIARSTYSNMLRRKYFTDEPGRIEELARRSHRQEEIPIAESERDETLQKVEALFSQLDSYEHLLLFLKYVHNYSIDALASATGKSKPAINSELFRLRNKLKEIIPDSDEIVAYLTLMQEKNESNEESFVWFAYGSLEPIDFCDPKSLFYSPWLDDAPKKGPLP